MADEIGPAPRPPAPRTCGQTLRRAHKASRAVRSASRHRRFPDFSGSSCPWQTRLRAGILHRKGKIASSTCLIRERTHHEGTPMGINDERDIEANLQIGPDRSGHGAAVHRGGQRRDPRWISNPKRPRKSPKRSWPRPARPARGSKARRAPYTPRIAQALQPPRGPAGANRSVSALRRAGGSFSSGPIRISSAL